MTDLTRQFEDMETRDELRQRMISSIERWGVRGVEAFDRGQMTMLIVPSSEAHNYQKLYPHVMTAARMPGGCIFATSGRYIETYA